MIGNICPARVGFNAHEPAEIEEVYGEPFKDTPYTLRCCKNCGVFYLTEESKSMNDVIGTV